MSRKGDTAPLRAHLCRYDGLEGDNATVVYGTDPFNLGRTAYASSMTYNTSRTCVLVQIEIAQVRNIS